MTNMTNEEQQKHEAAIQAWRTTRGDELLPRSPRRTQVGVLRLAEIDAICDLARRAPRPKPEPRASSALLESACCPNLTGY
jgi:hypothetical protein